LEKQKDINILDITQKEGIILKRKTFAKLRLSSMKNHKRTIMSK